MSSDASTSPRSVRGTEHLLVVGAGPGIGAATARRFAAEGSRVTLLARDQHRLEHLAEDLRAHGSRARAIQADAAEPEDLRAVLTDIFALPSPPDAVLYNAAQLLPDDLLTTSSENMVTAYVIDVVSAVVTAQVAAPSMHSAGGGTIIFTGGGLADDLHPGLATLSLGKLAMRGVARIRGKQLTTENIRIITVTINGMVASGTPFDPDHIADRYWQLTHRDGDAGFIDESFDGV